MSKDSKTEKQAIENMVKKAAFIYKFVLFLIFWNREHYLLNIYVYF